MTQPTILPYSISVAVPSNPMKIGPKVVLQDLTLEPIKVVAFGEVFDSLAPVPTIPDMPLIEVSKERAEETLKLDATLQDDVEVAFKVAVPEETPQSTDRIFAGPEGVSLLPKGQRADSEHTQKYAKDSTPSAQLKTDGKPLDVSHDAHKLRVALPDDIIFPMRSVTADVLPTSALPAESVMTRINPQPYVEKPRIHEAQFPIVAPRAWVEPQQSTDDAHTQPEPSKIAPYARGTAPEPQGTNPVGSVKFTSVEGHGYEKAAIQFTQQSVEVIVPQKPQDVQQSDSRITQMVRATTSASTDVNAFQMNAPSVQNPVDVARSPDADTVNILPVRQQENGVTAQNSQPSIKPDMALALAPQNVRPEVKHTVHERLASREHTVENRQSITQPHAYSIKSAIPSNVVQPVSEGFQKLLPREGLRDALVQSDGWGGASVDRLAPHSVSGPAVGTPAQMQDQARQIAAQMSAAITKTTQGTTEITLNPEELGRVRMTLNPSEGVMTMTVFADRPETMDLLRRHIDQLAQEFRDMGFDTMSFTFSENGSNAGDEEPQGQGDADHKSQIAVNMSATDEPTSNAASSGVDIRL